MLIGPDSTLGDEQSRMNQSTRGQWDWYAAHRAQIERLIRPEKPSGRICVLGAGNCNDLDLTWLVQAFPEVHLVDIDRSALERAIARQGVQGHARLRLHAPIDLTGIAALTAGWKGRQVGDEELKRAILAASESPAGGIVGQFDLVLSPCVLSQLLCGVRDLAGKDHPGWPALKSAIRARHLRTLLSLAAPAGRAVAIVDLSSTKSVPGLDRAKPEEAAGIMEMCVQTGKCFRGLEPRAMIEEFRRAGAASFEISTPWVWHLAGTKAFLCYGLTVRRT
jgi:hypothetical protein